MHTSSSRVYPVHPLLDNDADDLESKSRDERPGVIILK